MDEFGRSISTGFQLYLLAGFVTGIAYAGTELARVAVEAAIGPTNSMWWGFLLIGASCWGLGAARDGVISIAKAEDEN